MLVAESAGQLRRSVREFRRVFEGKELRVNVEKSNILVVGRGHTKMKVDMKDEGMNIETSFSEDKVPQEDVKKRVGERLKTLGAIRMMGLSRI